MNKIAILISLFLLVDFPCFLQETIQISIIGGRESQDEVIISVNPDITELSLSQIPLQRINRISGLSSLDKLERLSIEFAVLSDLDFSFLADMRNLKVLIFKFVTLKDLSFLSFVPDIEVVSLSEMIPIGDSPLVIDFSNNISIEYFELHGYGMSEFPEIPILPESLKVISFIGIHFSSFTESDALRIRRIVFEGIKLILLDRIHAQVRQYLPGIELYGVEMQRSVWDEYGL